MGVDNRRRRAAKQKKARRIPRAAAHRDADERVLAAELVWAAVEAIVDGFVDEAESLLAVIDTAPPAVDDAISAGISQRVDALQRHGWSDDDLREVEARRLKLPPLAPPRERRVRLLALLASMPPLPPTEARRPTTSSVDDGMLAKIRALLAKAESTTFPEEAEALSAKAQELMARHRIDHVLLDPSSGSEQPVGRRIWLDDPYSDAKARLLAAVAAANRCSSIQLTGLGCAHVVGFLTDLDVVELLHTSLLVQATAALAAAGPQRDRRGRSRTRSFRQSFLVAYAWRIGERLREGATAVETEVAESGAGAAVDLLPVLARRDDAVEEAVRAAFPHLESKRVSISNQAGWTAGTIAADGADLGVGPELRD